MVALRLFCSVANIMNTTIILKYNNYNSIVIKIHALLTKTLKRISLKHKTLWTITKHFIAWYQTFKPKLRPDFKPQLNQIALGIFALQTCWCHRGFCGRDEIYNHVHKIVLVLKWGWWHRGLLRLETFIKYRIYNFRVWFEPLR